MTMTTRHPVMALGAAVLLLALFALVTRDDDVPVDRTDPAARAAVEAARAVVPGELVDLRVDSDNDKWEVTLRAEGNEYEVELAPETLSFLRIDYD
jgi:hypothetical protein